MDIQLPIMDGYEATRRIKADPDLKAIPIIVVTSYALSAATKRKPAPPAATITSPSPTARALLAKIREHLHKSPPMEWTSFMHTRPPVS